MMFYTAAVNGVFAFLIAGGLLFTAHGVTTEFLLNLLFYIIITPVISLTLTRMMYMSESKMVVADALARIDSVLEAAPMQVEAVPQHPKDASVMLQDVHFSYDGKTEVIKGVSLKIQPGQMVAFVGPSGGGKSTLANLICRFFDVQSGSVRVGGADVRDIPKEELMDTISFVFQNSRLLKGSILDNVRLGRAQATEAEVLAALKAAQCMDIVEKFPEGIHAVIGTKGVYLSGGEQQRVAIARAMLKNAPILILDEATAFADPDNEAKVQAAFAQLAKGKTVLMIAHRLSTVANADCIYVVQDGQFVESVCAERSVCPDVAGVSGLGAVESRKGGVRNDRKNSTRHSQLPGGRKGACKGRSGLCVPEHGVHAAHRAAVSSGKRPAGRLYEREKHLLSGGMRCLLCADFADHMVPVQRHLFYHL